MSDETPDIVDEALERFDVCVEADAKQRQRELDDLRFQVPELQWPEYVETSRKAQIVNGITLAQRPMLSIPKLDQPIGLVLNQEKGAHLGVNVHPLTEAADSETAEVLQGLYRAIEVDSRASLARSWGFERFVKAGRGAYRILKEYDDDSDHPSDQKIVIKRIYEQGSVYMDPAASEPDCSDAEYAFIVEDVPLKRYKRLYKDSKLASYSDEEFVALGNERQGWISGDGDARAVRVCEYFYCEYETEDVAWEGGTRQKQKRVVHWCKLNAVEELESELWDGKYIPIVFLQKELIPFDGERRCVGMIGPNKDAQRLFNYAASGSVEAAALEPKAPFDVDPEEIAGYEQWWQQANTRNFPYLPRRKYVNGQPMGAIQRIQADTSKMQVNAMLLQQANEFIHAGTFTPDSALGNSTPNARTKGGTLLLQQQSELSNSHWLDVLAEVGMTHEARIVLDLIPFVYDRPGRVARILDLENNPKQVMFNAPFTLQGKRPVPAPPQQPGQSPPADVQHYDLTKGRYGVTVTIGKAYKSRVEQGKDELGQVFQADPELFKILGDLYFKFADFPGHQEASERMKKMLPPQLQDEDAQQDPKMALDQAKAALQQMQQQMQEMAKALETDKVKVEGQYKTAMDKAKIDATTSLALQKMKDATSIAVAQINAAVKIGMQDTEAQNEALATGLEQAHDAHQGAMDRTHEINQAVLDHQHALEAASQDHQNALEQGAAGVQGDAALAEQGQGHAMDQAQLGQDHALEQQQQAADLAPDPAQPVAGA